MSTTTTANLNEAMKVIFADPLITNVVTDTELMQLFEVDSNVQTENTTQGRYIEMAHYFTLPAGVGARAENEYIPVPDSPEFLNSRLFLRKLQGVVEMTGDTMRRVTGSEGAFLDYMSRALPDLVERLRNEIDRQYIGYGAGIKARTTQTFQGAGPYTVTLGDAFGVSGFQDPWLQFLEGEQIVFSGTAGGTTIRNAGTTQAARVTNIDEDLNQLTLVADAALAAAVQNGDYIASGDASGLSFRTDPGGEDREIAGLLAGCDDGGIVATYNNIARANRRYWQSLVFDASVAPWNGAMSEDLLTYADDESFVRGGGRVDCLVMSRSAVRGYWKSLKSDRFLMDPRQYMGGKSGVSILLGDRTLPLKVGRKIPPQVAFGLTLPSWRRLTLNAWEWDDRTGSIWNRVTDAVGRKDAYYAVGNMYEQLFCVQPRRNFRIDGLSKVQ